MLALFAAASGGVPPAYIEDVFNTWLYTGTGATQTITNGIDLSGKGGLTWIKGRSGATGHRLTDTARGATKSLASNSSDAEATETTGLTAFGTTGFTIGADADYNTSAATYASWTFREQPKFFDVVTYTGNSVSGRAISHNLGSVPGCIIVKMYSSNGESWEVYHRSTGYTSTGWLDSTAAFGTRGRFTQTPTDTNFYVTADSSVNASGNTYVAYLFAHDAGGFGLNGTDNAISCGSFTTSVGGTATVTLGYEPQWLMVKTTAVVGAWQLIDVMRGMPVGVACADLAANNSNAEGSGYTYSPTATGFTFATESSRDYVYIAIRRGPMSVPTVGTSVFFPQAYADASLGSTNPVLLGASTGFPVDMMWDAQRNQVAAKFLANDRLRGSGLSLATAQTAVEGASDGLTGGFATMNGALANGTDAYYSPSALGRTFVAHFFRRAPSFFDEVCYTGTGSNRTISHNLGVVPELIFVKGRSGATDWQAYSSALANTEYLVLNTTAAKATGATRWNSTTPTSSVFSLGTAADVNTNAATYVAYLFATCAGVSKVGSYTGTATTLQIDCGFTAGSRFVMIKRTDSTGDWYVWDSARGIIAGNDPYLRLNSTDVEITSTDYVDTYAAGFELSSTAPAALNASGGTYIFLAIA